MERKILALGIISVLLLTGVFTVIDAKTNKNDRGLGNGIDLKGPHFNLNIIGKKSDWNGNPGGSTDRHTMFVPENTETFSYIGPGGETFEGSIAIEFTQNSEFAVLDCNAFDDGWCHFQLAPGTYHVYIVAKAKPGFNTDITGWVYAEDSNQQWHYYMDVGTIKVTKAKKFSDATHLFYVSSNEDDFGIVTGDDVWVFTYMQNLEDYGEIADPDNPDHLVDIDETMYFWDFDNHGNKLVKLRFYPD